MWKKLRGSFLMAIGFLLSPLSWWNDWFLNLPLAYGFGYLCSLWQPEWILGGTLLGYWLSNVLGILLMQFGATDVMAKDRKDRNLKRDLIMSLASSTAYTLAIVGLVQLHIVDLSDLFPIS